MIADATMPRKPTKRGLKGSTPSSPHASAACAALHAEVVLWKVRPERVARSAAYKPALPALVSDSRVQIQAEACSGNLVSSLATRLPECLNRGCCKPRADKAPSSLHLSTACFACSSKGRHKQVPKQQPTQPPARERRHTDDVRLSQGWFTTILSSSTHHLQAPRTRQPSIPSCKC